MGAKVSAEMKRALAHVVSGAAPRWASKHCGVSVSALYRAMKRNGIQCTGTPGRRVTKRKRK